MNEYPLQRILEFLRTVAPFDSLSREELDGVVSHCEMAYYPRGTRIIRRGDRPPDHLHIVEVGSARITLPEDSGGEMLVDVRGHGDVFGVLSILQAGEALFDVTADEDMVAFLLDAAEFQRLVRDRPAFEHYFRFSLARDIRAAIRSSGSRRASECLPETGRGEPFLIGKTAGDMMARSVLSCAPQTSVQEAAGKMSRRKVGSILVTDAQGAPVGIVTDRDLRERVLAAGRPPGTPVAEVMSRSLRTAEPQAHAYDALLLMSRNGIHHLVVCEGGRPVGMLSEHDFHTEAGSSPVGLVRDIENAQTIETLIGLRPTADRILRSLMQRGGSVRRMVMMVTEINDRVTRRLIQLTERDTAREGGGEPPTPYTWMALGSEGRREQTLRTDQDNAMVFSSVPAEDEAAVRRWFLRFSERVVEGLVAYGFPRCPGGIMASNPAWCLSEAEWERTFLGWVKDPNPATLRNASIFFDFRPLVAGNDFLDGLRRRLQDTTASHVLFLRFMAKNGLYNRPPLGFLRQFVVEKSGEHKDKLNLKLRGMTPLVDALRVLALDRGVLTTNTLERLSGIVEKGGLDDGFAADLREAFNYIGFLRIQHHLEALARGAEPDNYLHPGALNGMQRKMLKESFGVIHRLQERIQLRYQTTYILET